MWSLVRLSGAPSMVLVMVSYRVLGVQVRRPISKMEARKPRCRASVHRNLRLLPSLSPPPLPSPTVRVGTPAKAAAALLPKLLPLPAAAPGPEYAPSAPAMPAARSPRPSAPQAASSSAPSLLLLGLWAALPRVWRLPARGAALAADSEVARVARPPPPRPSSLLDL